MLRLRFLAASTVAAALGIAGCEQQLPTRSLHDHLIAVLVKWDNEDKACRTGVGDAPETLAACARREGLGRELNEIGYCRFEYNEFGPYPSWKPCAGGPDA